VVRARLRFHALDGVGDDLGRLGGLRTRAISSFSRD